MYSNLTVGVLALQGDFEKHMGCLSLLDVGCREVRKGEDLAGLDGIIIPGGESTTMGELIDRFSMRDELENFCSTKAVWGTCAGMIMLAREVNGNRVNPLKAIDISVARNGYGRQIHSFYTEVEATLNGRPVMLKASFIRAPLVLERGPDVSVLSSYRNSPVLLAQKKCLVSAFHTELDDDLSLTKYFLEKFVSVTK